MNSQEGQFPSTCGHARHTTGIDLSVQEKPHILDYTEKLAAFVRMLAELEADALRATPC
jgi:hypothetical protein